jgi:hypothetical protein
VTLYAGSPARPPVRAGTLWAGGAAAALVAAGVAIVGFLIVRGLLDLPVLGVDKNGAVFQPTMVTYALLAALAALVATGVMHLLLLAAPAPRTFFGWIVALATLISMIVPLTVTQPWAAKVATALVNLAIGIAVGVLVSVSARAATSGPHDPPRYRYP